MAVLARTLTYVAQRLWQRFEAASLDPLAAQNAVLKRLLNRGAATSWGRQVRLGEISTIEQFRQRIPLMPYETAAPFWHRAFDGESNVMWPGHVQYFALSSGTTAGNKLLPVTRDAIRANLNAGTLLSVLMMRHGGIGKLGGKFLYLGGSTALRPKGACLCGDASGIMGKRIPLLVRRRRLPQPGIAALTDWDRKIAHIVRRYLTADVCMISACPSWAALLFKRLRAEGQRRGLAHNHIGELWPNLAFFVSFGMAFEPYRTAFEDLIGRPVRYIDTYSSSEGGLNAFQEEEGGPLRLILNNGVFYEFIPSDRAGEPNPPRLHIGEVQVGVDYAVVLTTNGGIWAYPLGDVIRFESLNPPRFRFVGRTQIMLSAFGEHVTLEMIENAIATACRATGAIVADFTIEPLYPSAQRPRPGHRWIIEFDRAPSGQSSVSRQSSDPSSVPPKTPTPTHSPTPTPIHTPTHTPNPTPNSDSPAFIDLIDRSLREANEDYDTHRTNDFGMDPPELTIVPPGTFYAWMKHRGKLGGQHKVPRVIKPEEAATLIAIGNGSTEYRR